MHSRDVVRLLSLTGLWGGFLPSSGSPRRRWVPFFGAVVAAVWLKDPLTLRKLTGMAVGLAGVVLLVGWHSEPLTGMTLLAVLACLAAALSYGVASVYAKRHMGGIESTSVALYSQLRPRSCSCPR